MENKKLRQIKILDTTLRDGEQAPENCMLPSQRLEIALELEQVGVDTIEVGFPASSKNDYEAVRLISKRLTKASYATFSRTKKADIDVALEAGGVNDNHILMLVATASDIHLKHKRGITREEGLLEISESVKYVKAKGINNIAVGLEDASRASIDYIKQIIDISLEAGANQIILADTTGYSVPDHFGNLVYLVKKYIKDSAKLSVHCHNDLGLAVSNSFEAIKNGADEIQVTIGGIGERAGNTSLEQIAAILFYKGKEYGVSTNLDISGIYKVYQLLQKCIHLEESRMQPLFGKYVFSTSAGIHQQGILQNNNTYEFVKPTDFGREQEFVVDLHSGRSILRRLMNDTKLNVNETFIEYIYTKYIMNGSSSTCYTQEQFKDILLMEANFRKEFEDGESSNSIGFDK